MRRLYEIWLTGDFLSQQFGELPIFTKNCGQSKSQCFIDQQVKENSTFPELVKFLSLIPTHQSNFSKTTSSCDGTKLTP
jgi:hypothetical protein